MWLCVGITVEEIPMYTLERWVTCNNLMDGGGTNIYGDCFKLETWEKILEVFGINAFTHLFIDGGLYGTLDDKTKIVRIITTMVTHGIIKYGNHILKKAMIHRIIKTDDPLGRGYTFTYIPIQSYSEENMEIALKYVLKHEPCAFKRLTYSIATKQCF